MPTIIPSEIHFGIGFIVPTARDAYWESSKGESPEVINPLILLEWKYKILMLSFKKFAIPKLVFVQIKPL